MNKSKSIAAIKRHRTARLARLVTRSYFLYRRGKKDQMSAEMYEAFVSFGGVYIKFLQGVMLKSEHMKKWHSPERLNIFENLDTEPLNIVSILQHELPGELVKQITGIQPEPFAAGSFGQVYYGQHIDGTAIIVKIIRPMVRELLPHDLRLIGLFVRRLYGKMLPNMDVNFKDAVKDFTKATLRETDYIAEAAFATELYNHYKDHPLLVIPKTYTELCTKNIIVQEYVGGLSAAQLIKLQQQGVNPKTYVAEQIGSNLDEQLEVLGYELMMGVLNLPRIQGDPHPGNIRLLPGNKVGMIDFGIAANTGSNKAAFLGLLTEWSMLYSDHARIGNLFEQFIRFFVSDLYRALKKLSSMRTPSESGDADFTHHLGKIAQNTFSKMVGTKDILPILQSGQAIQLVNKMINKDNRFGLVVKLDATEMMRAAQTYMTLVDALGRRNTVLPNVFKKVVAQAAIEHPELSHQEDNSMSPARAIETVTNWLERVAERDPILFRQLLERIKPVANKLNDVKIISKVDELDKIDPATGSSHA